MNLTVYHDASIFETLGDEWRTLVAASTTATPFQLPDFQAIWWQHFGDGQLSVLTWRDDTLRLVGLASVFIDSQAVLHWVGGESIADYLDIIAHPDHRTAVQTQCFAWIVAQPGWQRASFANIPDWNNTAQQWQHAAIAQGWQTSLTQLDVCPRIALPSTFETYLNSLDSKQRHELRRKLRRANAPDAEMGWRLVQGIADPAADVAQFLALLASSQAEKAAFLERPNMRAAFTALLTTLTARGLLQLAFLEYQHRPIAAYCSFDYQATIWLYNSGLQPGAAAAFAPGWVLLAYLIDHAITTQHHTFDFLQGNEDYKYRFGGQDIPVFGLTIQR